MITFTLVKWVGGSCIDASASRTALMHSEDRRIYTGAIHHPTQTVHHTTRYSMTFSSGREVGGSCIDAHASQTAHANLALGCSIQGGRWVAPVQMHCTPLPECMSAAWKAGTSI